MGSKLLILCRTSLNSEDCRIVVFKLSKEVHITVIITRRPCQGTQNQQNLHRKNKWHSVHDFRVGGRALLCLEQLKLYVYRYITESVFYAGTRGMLPFFCIFIKVHKNIFVIYKF